MSHSVCPGMRVGVCIRTVISKAQARPFSLTRPKYSVLPCTRHGLRPQEMDCVHPSAHSTTLPVDHLMARRGFNAHLVEDCIQGLDHSQLAAMYSRGEVKPSLSTRCVLANRVPSDSDSLHIAQRCLCVLLPPISHQLWL